MRLFDAWKRGERHPPAALERRPVNEREAMSYERRAMMVKVGIQTPTRAKAGSKMDQIVGIERHRFRKEYKQVLCSPPCSASLT